MSLLKSFSVNQIVNLRRRLIAIQQRAASHWVPDFKPGPYPKTKEERLAASKKYNLLPEEYEPYPDDGSGAGDYPKLPFESVDSKDPYYSYDHPELRRDYMEPVHRKFMILFPEMITTEKPPYDYAWGVLHATAAFATVMGILWYLKTTYKFNVPVLEKQQPYTGETHYLFKPDENYKPKSPSVCPESDSSTQS